MTTAEKIKEEIREIKIETKHCSQCNNDMREFKKYCIPHERQLEICQSRLSQYKSDLQQELEFLEKIFQDLDGDESNVIGDLIQDRITLIKKELKEIL